jgi:hypothetical protein
VYALLLLMGSWYFSNFKLQILDPGTINHLVCQIQEQSCLGRPQMHL